MVAYGKMKTRLLLIPNLVGATLAVLLILLLVPKFGGIGAGIALTLSGLVVVITMHGLMRAELLIMLPYKKLIQSIALGGGLFVMAIIGRMGLNGADNIIASISLLAILAFCFVPSQYWLLRSFFDRS